jgi:hypothetical protein
MSDLPAIEIAQRERIAPIFLSEKGIENPVWGMRAGVSVESPVVSAVTQVDLARAVHQESQRGERSAEPVRASRQSLI